MNLRTYLFTCEFLDLPQLLAFHWDGRIVKMTIFFRSIKKIINKDEKIIISNSTRFYTGG